MEAMMHCASLAGDARPHPKPRPAAEMFAEIVIDLAAEGFATRERIIERAEQYGLTSFDFTANETEIFRLARLKETRHDDPPAYDRADRIRVAAREIGHLLPPLAEITMHLQTRGFPKPELDDILDECLAKAADDFAFRPAGNQVAAQ
jgi:hypothetical protein